ncbi:MAG TPA: hypothetical protein VGU66_01705 [Candidatus Elarobacter sp.]|nr:hypothetical protein [Candidatus Elarobacter sp.]
MPFVLAALVAGCGGGGSSGGSGNPPPVPKPQGLPSVAPATVKITALASPAVVSVAETGYAGAFTVNAQPCAGIASITAGSAGAFTITGLAPGSCAITFTDTFAQSVAVPVSVTTSSVTAK